MRRMSKEAKWDAVCKIFSDINGGAGEGIEHVSISRRDVANALGCTKRTATKVLSQFVTDGLLEEEHRTDYGNFGIYEYWLSDVVLSWIWEGV